MTAPKHGDRVRLTLGESVVVGTVTATAPGLIVSIDGANEARVFETPPWQVEILPPLIPEIEGTVVLDADGIAWQRRNGWWRCSHTLRDPMRAAPKGATVLYVPGGAS